jgi:hypothetical protein
VRRDSRTFVFLAVKLAEDSAEIALDLIEPIPDAAAQFVDSAIEVSLVDVVLGDVSHVGVDTLDGFGNVVQDVAPHEAREGDENIE